jgi:hypothetical protein
MANLLSIRKVAALPTTYDPSTMYLVSTTDPTLFDTYISSSDGLSIKHQITKSEIQSLIAGAIGSFNNIVIVADIAARDALAPIAPMQALVIDATTDTTVTAGAATYIYDVTGAVWIKISESESIDLVLQWANIQNKPSSAVADIDDAVSKRHVHTNSASLAKIGEDLAGNMTYGSAPIRAYLDEEVW